MRLLYINTGIYSPFEFYNNHYVDLYNNYPVSLCCGEGLMAAWAKIKHHPTPGLTFSVQDFLQDKQNNGQQCERRDFFFMKNHHKGSCFIGGYSYDVWFSRNQLNVSLLHSWNIKKLGQVQCSTEGCPSPPDHDVFQTTIEQTCDKTTPLKMLETCCKLYSMYMIVNGHAECKGKNASHTNIYRVLMER